MYSIHPTIGVRIANQLIDERVRDAEARRVARLIRREARASSATPTPRRWWRIWPRSVRTSHQLGGA